MQDVTRQRKIFEKWDYASLNIFLNFKRDNLSFLFPASDILWVCHQWDLTKMRHHRHCCRHSTRITFLSLRRRTWSSPSTSWRGWPGCSISIQPSPSFSALLAQNNPTLKTKEILRWSSSTLARYLSLDVGLQNVWSFSKSSESFVLKRQTKKLSNSHGMFWIWREQNQSVQSKTRIWDYHTIISYLSSLLKTIKSTLTLSREMRFRRSSRKTILPLSGNLKIRFGETKMKMGLSTEL